MKKQFCICAAACLLSLMSFTAFSQAAPWVSDKGYWVVEQQRKQPKEHTVRFYNNDNVLIGTQQISGVRLKLKKEKVKMQLKTLLESAVVAWEQKRPSSNTPVLVKMP